ncbi:phage tail assembly chaperone G [Salinicoccus sesuvii]|uniref:Phage tail assembly chaperone G n=1 Tax=Salinicoccus sesuvii TaxID=868281 RepID=A0ABV7N3H3_9STAP
MANKLKRNYIQLVTGVKENGEPEFETFLTPHFIPADIWYECMDVLDEVETMEEKMNAERKAAEESGEAGNLMSSARMMKKQGELLTDAVVKIYDGQFDKKDIRKKYHAPDFVEGLQKQVEFIAMGQQDAATKKFVESQS